MHLGNGEERGFNSYSSELYLYIITYLSNNSFNRISEWMLLINTFLNIDLTYLYLRTTALKHLWDVVQREICFLDAQQRNLQQRSS